jgi:hypothetical protein
MLPPGTHEHTERLLLPDICHRQQRTFFTQLGDKAVNHHHHFHGAIVILNSGMRLNLSGSNAQKTETERASKTEG